MPSDPTPPPASLLGALLHPWAWRMAWRDSRTQRLRLLIFSLAIVSGIAALVAIHSLKTSLETGIETQAKELLGSDLQVSSQRPIGDADGASLSKMASRTAREVAFPSMLVFPNGSSRLVHVRGFEGAYPFYGRIETLPTDAWHRLGREQGVLLEPALLEQFQVKPGDEVELGSLRLKILGTIQKAAARSSRFSAIAPEAYVRLSDIQQSGLIKATSMVTHLMHLEIPRPPPSSQLKEAVRRDFPRQPWRLETPEDRRETLGDALDLSHRYLGILALASLALGALGVAGAAHSHIKNRIPAIAILRCLGAPGQLAAAIYVAQNIALGLLGSIIGAALGVALHVGVLSFFKDSLPIAITPSPEWKVVLRTTLCGFAVCCGFALVPVLKVRFVSPAIILRNAVAPFSSLVRSAPAYLWPVALLGLLPFAIDSDWKRSLIYIGGIAAAFALVTAVAYGLMALTRRIGRPAWPYVLRQGISNLHRPGNQTLLFLLSLGLATFLLLTLLLAGDLLQQRLRLSQSAESPNLYLIDVQPDQVEGVTSLVKKHRLPVLESAPMVSMRVQAIRGVPAAEAKDVPRWIANREFRSTYRSHLTSTESVIAGEWHETMADPGGPVPVSLEERIARDMRVNLGDTITLDVQGISMEARVTSLRKVDWSRFNLNFFMVFPPGPLEGAPGFHVVTTRTADATATGLLQRDLTKEFPNVSSIDLSQIFKTVREIFSQISLAVTLLGGLTLIAALPILIGTLLNGRDVRLRESILLRTLGASARQVRAILVVEYGTLGFLAGVTGVLLAVAASAALAAFAFKSAFTPDLKLLAAFLVAPALVSILGGLVLSRGVSTHPPLAVLRQT